MIVYKQFYVLFVYNKMNKQARHNHQEHGEHQEGDDCEGCQNERHQNKMLVNFYERLNTVSTKIGTIKDTFAAQKQLLIADKKKLQNMGNLMKKKPEDNIKSIKEHDSKEMGYQLAIALIQRDIKIKLENQRLQALIAQLQQQKNQLQSENKLIKDNSQRNSLMSFENVPKNLQKSDRETYIQKTKYSDSLDMIRKTEETAFSQQKYKQDMHHSYFQTKANNSPNKNYWQNVSQEETVFSTFSSKVQKQKSKDQNQYGLNLWLYQYKPQQIEEDTKKSLQKLSKKDKKVHNRYKSKF